MNEIRVVPTRMRHINILGIEEFGPHHKCLVCDDPKASFMFTDSRHCGTKVPEFTPLSKVDYNLTPPPALSEVYKGTEFEKKGLPLSFLNVRTVDEGEQWYRENTRYPNCLLPMLARYQWGDLRHGVNKKAVKNAKKKDKRRRAKAKAKNKCHIKYEPCVVTFD